MLRADFAGEPTFGELLERVRDATLGAFAHQDLPFERLVFELHPTRELGRNPIVQVAFALQNAPEAPLELPGLTIGAFPIDSWTTRFDAELHLWDDAEGGLAGSFFYSTDLFDDATAQRIVQRFTALMAAVAAQPDRRLSAFPVLGQDEWERSIHAWNATATAYPRESTIAEVFAEVARGRVREPAVVFEGGSLTYGELLHQALQVGAALRARGIGRASRVGLALDRSPGFVTAALGVLFAGGAYVPVDPDSPRARTARMLCDAQVALVIGRRRR